MRRTRQIHRLGTGIALLLLALQLMPGAMHAQTPHQGRIAPAPPQTAPAQPPAPAADQLDLRPYVRLSVTGVIETFKNPVIKNGEMADPGTLVNTERGEYSSGSGTIISPDGLIVTNYHVLQALLEPIILDYNAKDKILVRATPIRMLVGEVDPREPLARVEDHYTVEPLVWVEERDIALVKIATDARTGAAVKRHDFAYTSIGNPYSIPLLAPLFVFGYPGKGGRSINPSTGPFQGYTWDVEGAMDGSIKTSAQIAGGNSGGAALFNGQLIAIPTRVSAKEEKGSDFGYLHPITWAAQTLSYARLRFGTAVPKFESTWLESRNNTDDSRTMSYVGGTIVSGQSQQVVKEATILVYRPDRTLEQIVQLDTAVGDLVMAFRVKESIKAGWTEDRIAEALKLKPQQVRAYRDMKIDAASGSPDLQAYERGDFFYEVNDSQADGFFFVKVPRGQPVNVAILKDGFRNFEGKWPAVTTIDRDAGRIPIFVR